MKPSVCRLATLLLLISGYCTGSATAQFKFELPPNLGGEASTEPVRLEARIAPATTERPALLLVTATVAPGYHLYSLTQPAGGPEPSKLSLRPMPGVRVGAFSVTPAPQIKSYAEIWPGLPIEEHSGKITWFAPIDWSSDLERPTVAGVLTTQACDAGSCEPLELEFTAKPSSAPASAEIAAAWLASPLAQPADISTNSTAPPVGSTAEPLSTAALLPILGAALLGGLILNLMPCVLPVIGLKVLSFAEQAGHQRGRVLAMNLAYSAGLIGVFLLLALLASLAQLGLANESLGWGELYTIAWFKIAMIVLVFAMALSFLGVWEIPLPGFAGARAANDLQQQEGLSGAFFKGIFTTILATPCSGPFLGPVFGFTLGQPPAITLLIFGFVGLGMASPYLLIGLFPSLVAWLPKPGAWMETFKQLMGFVLMGTVVYLFSTVSTDLYLPALTTLVAIALACWWIGRTPITASPVARSTAWYGGAGVAAVVGWLAFSLASYGGHDLAWKPYSQASLAAAQNAGKTVLVDFTADWCLTCKLNLKLAINTDQVKAVVEANDIEPLLADWTDRNDEIKQAIEALGSRSIPLLAIYPAGRPDRPILLWDRIKQEQLLSALREAGATIDNGGELVEPTIEIGVTTGGAMR
ncbi:protein-disulfide reductase DsbD family protein [Botrimarina hoheduenensis]|uniref:Thiol:disulfide interchange protein DsbD n=1 Tax=Botrimarina hoheduenensis TaxID=2528000 RepID=A0A5C5WCL2_9BACT|nr:thioredoxin family protein [Botrimarina hoheduenensis]TWT47815.1 Thiol:disulfide interchange protein DsbD precursor [Botrimarina hoheduenensis]